MSGYPTLGAGTSGTGLTEPWIKVLNQLEYDEEKGWLLSSVPFSTTLSTLWLSDQWGLSSGGKTPFFFSKDQGIHFSPVVSGVKLQEPLINRDSSGLIAPFYRKLSDDLVVTSLKGAINPTPGISTPYEGTSLLTANTSLFAIHIVLEESLKEGDKITYRLWSGEDDTGDVIFEQNIYMTADREPGFNLMAWWATPSEGFKGETVFARLIAKPLVGSEHTLVVRATAEDENVHWNEIYIRTFTDQPIATEESVNTAIGQVELRISELHDLDTIHTQQLETIYYREQGEILWP